MTDYVMKDLSVGKINSTNSSSKYFVSGKLRNTKFRHAKATTIVIFDTDDQEFVDAVRSVFPKNDKNDQNAPKFYGTNPDIKPSEFTPEKLKEAMKTLRDWDGEDLLLFPNGAREEYQLTTPMVMKYRGNIGGHAEGDWVCKPGSKFVKIWYSLGVFVEKDDEGGYVEGFSSEESAQNRIRTMIPLLSAGEEIKQKGCEIDPIDLATIRTKYGVDLGGGSYVIPTGDEEASTGDAPKDDDDDE